MSRAWARAASRLISLREHSVARASRARTNFAPATILVGFPASFASFRAFLLFNLSTLLFFLKSIQRDIDFTTGISEFLAGENEIIINLEAPIVLTGLFVPHLIRKKEAAIINISSGLGFVPAARMPVYSASKAGLHAFSMALRHQLLTSGIKVFEVVPPAVDTELNPEGRSKRGGFKADLKPEEFVAAIMKGFKNNIFEIGYGMTEGLIKASREDLNKSFQRMNSQW